MYDPVVAVAATVKLLPTKSPEELIAHDTEANKIGDAGDCRKLQRPESAVANPLPVTEIAAPVVPDVGFTVTVGEVTVTVNPGSEMSPVLPLT